MVVFLCYLPSAKGLGMLFLGCFAGIVLYFGAFREPSRLFFVVDGLIACQFIHS